MQLDYNGHYIIRNNFDQEKENQKKNERHEIQFVPAIKINHLLAIALRYASKYYALFCSFHNS